MTKVIVTRNTNSKEMASTPKLFNPEWLSALPEDTDEAIVALFDEHQMHFNQKKHIDHTQMVESYVLLKSFCGLRKVPVEEIDINSNDRSLIAEILHVYREVADRARKRVSIKRHRKRFEKYDTIFSTRLTYVFSDEGWDRVQQLINELRGEISKSKVIPEDHRRRLLKKLEAMQLELHKKTSDFTLFWGLFGEMGVAAGKFGTDIKPIVDRFDELAQIVVSVIKAAEGITIGFSPVKLLETAMSKKDSEDSDAS